MKLGGGLSPLSLCDPASRWHCHSPNALFYCMFKDEFEGNSGNLRGNIHEVRKNTEEISWVSQEQDSGIPEPSFQSSE